jgi:hypothetical protein
MKPMRSDEEKNMVHQGFILMPFCDYEKGYMVIGKSS